MLAARMHEMLRHGGIVGRAVIVFDVKVNTSDRKDAKDATAAGRGASQSRFSATQGYQSGRTIKGSYRPFRSRGRDSTNKS